MVRSINSVAALLIDLVRKKPAVEVDYETTYRVRLTVNSLHAIRVLSDGGRLVWFGHQLKDMNMEPVGESEWYSRMTTV